MPPKNLKDFKKKVRQDFKEGQLEFRKENITIEMVKNESKLATLRKWAKTLGVTFRSDINIETLKRLMISELNKPKEEIKESSTADDTIFEDQQKSGNENENEYIKRQNQAIEKFLESYLRDRKNTSRVFGELGSQFEMIWKQLPTINSKIKVARDYLALKPNNPIKFLTKYIREKVGYNDNWIYQEYVIDYHRWFIDQKYKIPDYSGLINPEFIRKLETLDNDDLQDFATQFGKDETKPDPMAYLRKYLVGDDIEEKEETKTLLVQGAETYPKENTVPVKFLNEKQKRMVKKLRGLQWLIKPVNEKKDEYYTPGDDFYKDIVLYGARMKSSNEFILILQTPTPIEFNVKQQVNPQTFYNSPTSMYSELLSILKDDITGRLPIDWILNTNVEQLGSKFLDQLVLLLESKTKVNFGKYIANMRNSFNDKPFKEYIETFLLKFFPFLSKENTYIVDHVNNGVLSPENYMLMQMFEKVPEKSQETIESSIRRYIPFFTEYIINSAYKYIPFTPMEYIELAFDTRNTPSKGVNEERDALRKEEFGLYIQVEKYKRMIQSILGESSKLYTNTNAEFRKEFKSKVLDIYINYAKFQIEFNVCKKRQKIIRYKLINEKFSMKLKSPLDSLEKQAIEKFIKSNEEEIVYLSNQVNNVNQTIKDNIKVYENYRNDDTPETYEKLNLFMPPE